ncbi:MAG: hypothetical protein E7658_01660 [Ruminococcaceae bacterium]|nr:hypothetical protein [Oscillospiraceae bacterium]
MVHFRLHFSPGRTMTSLTNRAESAAQALRQAVLTSCTPYVPYRTGELFRSGAVTDTGVIWTADHARKCYYAKRPFSRSVHPLAQAGWFEAAKAADLALWCETAARAVTKNEV